MNFELLAYSINDPMMNEGGGDEPAEGGCCSAPPDPDPGPPAG